ncbi:hypothetical protein [Algibacter sp. R77976]|uniref:hypothetical protein n=1 Tax=Algibacter sp. R77976 TaxID=3093873 RepID=UPI0037C5D9E1
MRFKLVYIVHGLILLLFIVSAIYGYNRLVELNFFIYDDELNFYNFLDLIVTHKVFRPLIILIAPTIGVFLKNRYGWVFITSYFYFLICSICSVFFEDGFSDYKDILLFVSIVLLITLIIIIMNIKKVSFHFYKINKIKLLGLNLVSFVVGMCSFILLLISKTI